MIPWTADNKKLIDDLFDKLDENDTIRKGIWPEKGARTGGSKKVVLYSNLACSRVEGRGSRTSALGVEPIFRKDNYSTTLPSRGFHL